MTSSQATSSLTPLNRALAGGTFEPSLYVQCFVCGVLLNEQSDAFVTCKDCGWSVCSKCSTCASTCACDLYSVVALELLFS